MVPLPVRECSAAHAKRLLILLLTSWLTCCCSLFGPHQNVFFLPEPPSNASHSGHPPHLPVRIDDLHFVSHDIP